MAAGDRHSLLDDKAKILITPQSAVRDVGGHNLEVALFSVYPPIELYKADADAEQRLADSSFSESVNYFDSMTRGVDESVMRVCFGFVDDGVDALAFMLQGDEPYWLGFGEHDDVKKIMGPGEDYFICCFLIAAGQCRFRVAPQLIQHLLNVVHFSCYMKASVCRT